MPGQNGSAPEAEEEGSSQSSGKGSRATTAEQLIAQQAVRPRQSSIHQMTDNIVTSEALEDQAIHDTLDTIMCDNAKDFPFNFGDPRQQLSWEAQSFDFTAECLPMHSGAQIFPTLSVKVNQRNFHPSLVLHECIWPSFCEPFLSVSALLSFRHWTVL